MQAMGDLITSTPSLTVALSMVILGIYIHSARQLEYLRHVSSLLMTLVAYTCSRMLFLQWTFD